MHSTRPFIKAEMKNVLGEIDADLLSWLNGNMYPGIQYSGSLPRVYWRGFLDKIVLQIIDKAFDTARRLAAEYSVDPIDAANTAGEVAEDTVRNTISKMVEFDRKMRGKGFPKSVALKDASLEIKRSVATIENRRKAEVALLEDSISNRELQAARAGKQRSKGDSDPWFKKPFGMLFFPIVAGLFVALCKRFLSNILK